MEEDKENQIDDAVEDLHLSEEEEHSFCVHHMDWFVDVIAVCVDHMLDLVLVDGLIYDENCSLAQQEYCQASSKVFLEGEGVDLYQGVRVDHECAGMMPYDSMIGVV